MTSLQRGGILSLVRIRIFALPKSTIISININNEAPNVKGFTGGFVDFRAQEGENQMEMEREIV
jgi:hypothetical protein